VVARRRGLRVRREQERELDLDLVVGAAGVAEPELAVVAAVGELVMAVESVAVEGREPAAERRGEPKVPGLENG